MEGRKESLKGGLLANFSSVELNFSCPRQRHQFRQTWEKEATEEQGALSYLDVVNTSSVKKKKPTQEEM